jgi:hypothetical protein
MSEQFERFARPTSDLVEPGVVSPRGINRNHLTLYLSIAALVLSIGSVAVQGFIFWAADWKKKIAETELLQVQRTKEEALARAAQLDVALKEQQIKTSAAQEKEAIAAARDHNQDATKKGYETQSAERDAAARKRLLNDANVERLGLSADKAAGVSTSPDPGLQRLLNPPPIVGGASGSLAKKSTDQIDPNDPIKKRGPIK